MTDDLDEVTGEQLAEEMYPDARKEAREELSRLAPGGSEPFHIRDQGQRTETDEDPISEGGASRKNRI